MSSRDPIKILAETLQNWNQSGNDLDRTLEKNVRELANSLLFLKQYLTNSEDQDEEFKKIHTENCDDADSK